MEENKEVKKTAPRKPRTTKPKEEEQQLDLQAQMAAMMQMMMQQQQQIMELMARQQEVEEEKEEENITQKTVNQSELQKEEKKEEKITKRYLRKHYKDEDIYLTSVVTGIVNFNGKNEVYRWRQKGECVPVSMDDILAMNDAYLHTPLLIIDEDENNEEIVKKIKEGLGLDKVDKMVEIVSQIEDNINEVDIDELEKIISTKEGKDLIPEISLLVQEKILDGTMDNMKLIKKYEKILHKNFKKE